MEVVHAILGLLGKTALSNVTVVLTILALSTENVRWTAVVFVMLGLGSATALVNARAVQGMNVIAEVSATKHVAAVAGLDFGVKTAPWIVRGVSLGFSMASRCCFTCAQVMVNAMHVRSAFATSIGVESRAQAALSIGPGI